MQRRILGAILNKVEVPDYIHAFEKDRSIPEMAAQHINKFVVISLDLKDYFGSIKQSHLNVMFNRLGFSDGAATTLSEVCTYKSFVPQGALTSPKISNIITMLTFGPKVKEFCDAHGLTLTIFADDITISSTRKLTGENGTLSVTQVIQTIKGYLEEFRFKLNREKIKVMSNYQRQYVCGAVVNQKVNLQKTERNKLRAIVHNCRKNGIEAEAVKSGMTTSEFSSKIMGHLNWYSQLNPTAGNIEKAKFKEVAVELCQPSADQVVPGVINLEGVASQPKSPEVAPW